MLRILNDRLNSKLKLENLDSSIIYQSVGNFLRKDESKSYKNIRIFWHNLKSLSGTIKLKGENHFHSLVRPLAKRYCRISTELRQNELHTQIRLCLKTAHNWDQQLYYSGIRQDIC
jgi:hypothetical protein